MTGQTTPETPAGRPSGDTGDGETGVPEFEQGISNRPGDKAESETKDDAQGEPLREWERLSSREQSFDASAISTTSSGR